MEMPKNIYVHTLIMEVTRRCNGGKPDEHGKFHPCAHCLRGNPQPVNMSDEIIEAVAKSRLDVTCLTLSGGEPTLVPGIIDKIFTRFEETGLEYYEFYLVTNGMRHSPKTVKILNREYEKVAENSWFSPDNWFGGLAMSIDPFHTYNPDAHYKYQMLPYYTSEHEYRDPKKLYKILDEGLAHEHGLGQLKRENIEVDVDGQDATFDKVYVNALGDVVLDCDYSYETQKKKSIGNVLKIPLKEILLRYIEQNQNNLSVYHCEAC